MSDYQNDPTLVAVIISLEALELRLGEAGACVSEALTGAVRGHLNRAVGAVVPLAATLPEANALVSSIMVLHRHAHRESEPSPGLFAE